MSKPTFGYVKANGTTIDDDGIREISPVVAAFLSVLKTRLDTEAAVVKVDLTHKYGWRAGDLGRNHASIFEAAVASVSQLGWRVELTSPAAGPGAREKKFILMREPL
jgi:hypothetical protein